VSPPRRYCGCVCPVEGEGVCVLPWGHKGGHRAAWRREEGETFGRPWAQLRRIGWGVPMTWQASDIIANFMQLAADEVRA
jgi:hypothetical protein